jgi:hypothetical protein
MATIPQPKPIEEITTEQNKDNPKKKRVLLYSQKIKIKRRKNC